MLSVTFHPEMLTIVFTCLTCNWRVSRGALEYYYTTRPEGLGMGLPLSRTIVEGHGGQIRVASDPGRGTEVVITLKQADTRRTP